MSIQYNDFKSDADQVCRSYINDRDQVRLIDSPDEFFDFRKVGDETANNFAKELMNSKQIPWEPTKPSMLKEERKGCLRKSVLDRLIELYGFEIRRLPADAKDGRHVRVLVSNLDKCKRAIVFFGPNNQDLGIINNNHMLINTIHSGSVLDWVKYVKEGQDAHEVGIVIANPGQSAWLWEQMTAVTHHTWMSLGPAYGLDTLWELREENKIPRNNNLEEHVQCVFYDINLPLRKTHRISLDIIAMEACGYCVVEFLDKEENWTLFGKDLAGIVCVGSWMWPRHYISNRDLYNFWETVCALSVSIVIRGLH